MEGVASTTGRQQSLSALEDEIREALTFGDIDAIDELIATGWLEIEFRSARYIDSERWRVTGGVIHETRRRPLGGYNHLTDSEPEECYGAAR